MQSQLAVEGKRVRRPKMPGRWGLMVLMLLVGGLTLAACGGGSDSTSTDVAATSESGGSESTEVSESGGAQQEAEAAIDEHREIPKFTLKAPTFDAKKAAGKKIMAIPIASINEFNVAVDRQMAEIGANLGVEVTEYENQGTPTEWAKGIEQAIAQKADAIVMTGGGDPSLVLPQIKRAKAAGIPTIISHYYQYGEAPDDVQKDLGAFVYVAFDEAAELMADFAFSQKGEDLNALIITAKEAVPSAGMVESIENRLGKLCPSCETTLINVPVAEWETKLQGAVQSALAQNPDINYILPIYDPMVIGVQSGVTAAGKTTSVSIASYATTPDVLKLIQDGETVQMDVGESTSWVAYATMDQALRLLSGNKPIPGGDNNEKLGLRVFDDSNVDETGTPPESSKGFGDEYVQGYEKLWGLK